MLSENYVLVTGGDRGIGRATVLKFASEGFNVGFTYYRRRDEAVKTAKQASEKGVEVFYTQMDVSDEKSVAKALNEFSNKFPYLNVLVNNAGVFSISRFEDTSIEEWERIIKINLTGVFLVTKYSLPLLRKAPWASIVNVASVAGQTGNVFASAAYCASKAGVIGFTRRLAVELAPHIRVNAVAPSFVETDMVKEFIDTPEKRKRVAELHPLKDIAKPEDIANAIYFLATKESRFITGQILSINGGRFTC